MYRAPDSCRCAAGCLIRDSEYDPKMEGLNFEGVLNMSAPLYKRLGKYLALISDLQAIHDFRDVEHWEKAFEKLALQYRLVYTPPTVTKDSK